jgi:hypothetical protein
MAMRQATDRRAASHNRLATSQNCSSVSGKTAPPPRATASRAAASHNRLATSQNRHAASHDRRAASQNRQATRPQPPMPEPQPHGTSGSQDRPQPHMATTAGTGGATTAQDHNRTGQVRRGLNRTEPQPPEQARAARPLPHRTTTAQDRPKREQKPAIDYRGRRGGRVAREGRQLGGTEGGESEPEARASRREEESDAFLPNR